MECPWTFSLHCSVKMLANSLVYAVLLLTAVYIVTVGPIAKLVTQETTFTQSFHKLDEMEKPIEWPAMMVCKMPRDKDRKKYQEFLGKGFSGTLTDEVELEEMLKNTFYKNVSELVHAVTIGTAYMQGLNRAKEIPLEPPYVNLVLVDFLYLGYCASISFQALRTFLIAKEDINADEKDSNFIAMIFLQGTTDENSQYVFKFIPENETVGMISPESFMTTIYPGTYNLFTLNFDMRIRLTNCNDKVDRMTPCVYKNYDKIHGTNSSMILKKNMDMNEAVFAGVERLETASGCKRPCKSFEYSVEEYVRYDNRVSMDGSKSILDESGNGSSMIVINHLKKRAITKYEEVPTYTVISFISDVGGILGIFLGSSFWTLYDCIMARIAKKEGARAVPNDYEL